MESHNGWRETARSLLTSVRHVPLIHTTQTTMSSSATKVDTACSCTNLQGKGYFQARFLSLQHRSVFGSTNKPLLTFVRCGVPIAGSRRIRELLGLQIPRQVRDAGRSLPEDVELHGPRRHRQVQAPCPRLLALAPHVDQWRVCPPALQRANKLTTSTSLHHNERSHDRACSNATPGGIYNLPFSPFTDVSPTNCHASSDPCKTRSMCERRLEDVRCSMPHLP